ncbi:MAG: hypothetical protein V1773_17230 [bacterium]
MKKIISVIVFSFISLMLLFSCVSLPIKEKCSVEYSEIDKLIKINEPTKADLLKFNSLVLGEAVTLKKGNLEIEGCVTENKLFYSKIIKPNIVKYLDTLLKMPKAYAINEITLLVHQLYSVYFGKDFYRWGGDINDLDDPQGKKFRGEYRYGLDCSGFTTSSYEIAVDLGIINNKDSAAQFSSKGFKYFCEITGLQDSGGIDNTSNNFRVDTKELANLGNIVFTIPEGGQPTEEEIKLLQPGDIVGRSGHFGIIVFINNKPYYLESGGWVVPAHGGVPYCAKEALKIFAQNGSLFIRRVLPTINNYNN